jgi:hypothetical protein
MTPLANACIIRAGCSGFTTAKRQSLHIDTSTTRLQFEEFPAPAGWPHFSHHSLMRASRSTTTRRGTRSRSISRGTCAI